MRTWSSWEGPTFCHVHAYARYLVWNPLFLLCLQGRRPKHSSNYSRIYHVAFHWWQSAHTMIKVSFLRVECKWWPSRDSSLVVAKHRKRPTPGPPDRACLVVSKHSNLWMLPTQKNVKGSEEHAYIARQYNFTSKHLLTDIKRCWRRGNNVTPSYRARVRTPPPDTTVHPHKN